MGLKMPNVFISFKEKGITAIQRSQRGIIAMVFPVSNPTDNITQIYNVDDIPESWTKYKKEQVELALKGYQTSPRKVIVLECQGEVTSTVPKEGGQSGETEEKTVDADFSKVLKKLEKTYFNWLVIPSITSKYTETIATWIKGMRTTKDTKVCAVLPNCNADNEGIVNFTNTLIKTKAKTYETADYCSRIAGIICGTPAIISCTYAPLPELVEVEQYTDEEMDAKIGRGELFVFFDGEKHKIARGINSFVTTMQGKGESFKKIKLIDLMDMIHYDIKKTSHDSYIGKYANSYDNRCLLITAINGYLHTLETEGLLEKGQNNCYIDETAVKNWRESNGKNTREELENMSSQQIKELNIHDNAFLAADLSPLDALENVTLNCTVE
jgi:phage tail sheath protein|nr:MAG TPA: tail sheath protein [Caudoviricetes sp.]